MEKLKGLTVSEAGQMLKDCTWREVKKGWVTEKQKRLKQRVLLNLMEGEGQAGCVQVERKGLRRILTKLRGGAAELRIETGRWVRMKWDERICAQCSTWEVEDVKHALFIEMQQCG